MVGNTHTHDTHSNTHMYEDGTRKKKCIYYLAKKITKILYGERTRITKLQNEKNGTKTTVPCTYKKRYDGEKETINFLTACISSKLMEQMIIFIIHVPNNN